MITSVVMHFYNEELLIGAWLDHHKNMFDHGILINHQSTDASLEIIKDKLPRNWQIVDTKLSNFDAVLNDREVMDYEQSLPGWKIALNTTEFLFQPDLRQFLADMIERYPTTRAFGSRAACLIDKDEALPLEKPIWVNRTWGFLNYEAGIPTCRRWRYIHNAEHGHYSVGRHTTGLPRTELPDFLHLHFASSPWPECLPRKLQIQTRIPESDKQARLGFSHIATQADLEQSRQDELEFSSNLLQHPRFRFCYDALLGANHADSMKISS